MSGSMRVRSMRAFLRDAVGSYRRNAVARIAAERAWARAGTPAELGDLMATWLTGETPCSPGFSGGPSPETAPLIPVLAAVNRAGFVTIGSQPGVSESPGYDGALWRQRAGVEGFVEDAAAAACLTVMARAAGLNARVGRAKRRTDYRHCTVVSERERQPTCSFGAVLGRREIAGIFDLCAGPAVKRLQGSWQVTLVDSIWGRDDVLWSVLAEFADRNTARVP